MKIAYVVDAPLTLTRTCGGGGGAMTHEPPRYEKGRARAGVRGPLTVTTVHSIRILRSYGYSASRQCVGRGGKDPLRSRQEVSGRDDPTCLLLRNRMARAR